ncbi:MAG: DUF5615 family PIN-like protein [Haliscomenobacter sp.]|nr:DUF5615 family PIN-like protein [Haliscomenobacter sp.]MBK8879026.1 DUF5615 family PIN-like protein [Haliscomenobacter sp.]
MDLFLADESVDFRIIRHIRKKGYGVKAITETNPGISDEEVLQIANEMGAILITEDKDFGELTYRLRKPNQGIVLIRMPGIPIMEKIEKIAQVLESYAQDLKKKFTVITMEKVRIKDLK